jgi:hypothetical protein
MIFTATEVIGFSSRVMWNVIPRNLFHWKDDLLMYGGNA